MVIVMRVNTFKRIVLGAQKVSFSVYFLCSVLSLYIKTVHLDIKYKGQIDIE